MPVHGDIASRPVARFPDKSEFQRCWTCFRVISTKAIVGHAPPHVAAPRQIELVVARDAGCRAAAHRPWRGGRAPDGGLHGTPFARARARFVLAGTPHPRDLGRDCGPMAGRYGCCLRPTSLRGNTPNRALDRAKPR